MILSEDRAAHFAKLIIDGIWNQDLVDYSDEDMAMRVGRSAIQKCLADLDQIDMKVKTKITSLKRNVHEGSPEWDILYSKYLDEEMIRSGNK